MAVPDAARTDDAVPAPTTSRIEGGFDAIVLGGGPESLVAAAYLGRAGLDTVLLDADVQVGATLLDREFAEGAVAPNYEHLVYNLDPRAVRDLGLYRHGLAYSARRLGTRYHVRGSSPFDFDADLWRAADGLDARFEGDAAALERLLNECGEIATGARLYLAGEDAAASPERPRGLFERRTPAADSPALSASAADYLGERIASDDLAAALATEAVFRYACEPSSAFSFAGFLRRLAGETAGLRGGFAYPAGGMTSLVDALRRAAQSAGVEIRSCVERSRVLIEWDAVAGVELPGGGQMRGPVVVSGLDARSTFLELVGPADLDIEIDAEASRPPSGVGAAKANVLIDPRSAFAKSTAAPFAGRRDVVTSSTAALDRAYAAARRGAAPDDLIVEAVASPRLDAASADGEAGGPVVLSLLVHPVPASPRADVRRRIESLAKESLAALEIDPKTDIAAFELLFAADFAKRHGVDAGAFAAAPPVVEQWLRARALSSCGVAGLFFCGPEASVAPGVSGAAGRRAAARALRYARARKRAA